MKRGLLAVLLVACATSVSSGENSVQEKIEDAVLPLPAAYRDGAEVFSYDAAWNRTVLRKGTNSMHCQASGSATLAPKFVAACFHESLEPAIVRGKQLRAQGMETDEARKTLFAEIGEGKVAGPIGGAVGFNMSQSGLVTMNVYAPGATAESTGLFTKRDANEPWLMLAGTPMAHVMIPGK